MEIKAAHATRYTILWNDLENNKMEIFANEPSERRRSDSEAAAE